MATPVQGSFIDRTRKLDRPNSHTATFEVGASTTYEPTGSFKNTAFLIEADREGITLNAEEKKMGIKGSSTRQVFFNDVKIPVENLLYEREKGFKIAVDNLVSDSVKANGLVYQGIELTKDVGIYFVSSNNGADTNDGNNPGGPFATLTKALSVAVDGDLIYIYPVSYTHLTLPTNREV